MQQTKNRIPLINFHTYDKTKDLEEAILMVYFEEDLSIIKKS